MFGLSILDIILTLFGLAAVGYGLRALYGAIYLFQQEKKCATWPKTRGEVISFKLGRRYRTRSTSEELAGHGSTITYRYQVDQASYQGHALYVGSTAWFDGYIQADKVQSLREKFQPGNGVDVHYDPQNPQQAVIYPYIMKDSALFEFGAGGAVMVILGGLLLWWGLA